MLLAWPSCILDQQLTQACKPNLLNQRAPSMASSKPLTAVTLLLLLAALLMVADAQPASKIGMDVNACKLIIDDNMHVQFIYKN